MTIPALPQDSLSQAARESEIIVDSAQVEMTETHTDTHAPTDAHAARTPHTTGTRVVEEARERAPSHVSAQSHSSFSSLFSSSNAHLPVPRERAPTFTPRAPENSPTVLTFAGITVKTKSAKARTLLSNVSGSITGGFWAIMGASGSGKTTLLSTLSLRVDPRYVSVEGEFRLNGREYSRADLKAVSGYVLQDDLLFAELTVQETLYYAAELRMRAPSDTSDKRLQRIDEVLALLEITHCRNIIIGNSRRKGISGGERKRVSVALEMLNRPILLFLDAPTNGLDSTTAYTVTKVFKKMSELGECTIVCSIEQPSPRVFALFDNLILLKKGELFYIGHSMKTVKFLDVIGKPCPSDLNLADHIINVLSEESPDARTETQGVLDKEILHPQIDLSLGIEKPLFAEGGASLWVREVVILTERALQSYLRRTDIIFFNLIATVVVSIFISCGAWYKIGNGQSSLPAQLAPLFFVVVNQGVVGSIQTVTSFPSERAVMLRERAAGSYTTSSYFVAKTISDMLTAIWTPLVLALIVYFSIGYAHDAGEFFFYAFFLVLTCWAAMSLSTAVVCTCVTFERSIVVMSFLFEVSRLFGGYYTSPALLDEYPDWRFADALSYAKYAYVGLALNHLSGLEIECDVGDGTGCAITSGQQLIKHYGYDEYSVGACVGYLFVLIVGFRLIGYLGLRFVK